MGCLACLQNGAPCDSCRKGCVINPGSVRACEQAESIAREEAELAALDMVRRVFVPGGRWDWSDSQIRAAVASVIRRAAKMLDGAE